MMLLHIIKGSKYVECKEVELNNAIFVHISWDFEVKTFIELRPLQKHPLHFYPINFLQLLSNCRYIHYSIEKHTLWPRVAESAGTRACRASEGIRMGEESVTDVCVANLG